MSQDARGRAHTQGAGSAGETGGGDRRESLAATGKDLFSMVKRLALAPESRMGMPVATGELPRDADGTVRCSCSASRRRRASNAELPS